MRRKATLPALLLGWLLPSCQAFVGDYEADRNDGATIDVSPLCAVERSAFVFDLDLTSNDSRDSLEAYYEAANPELVDHLSAVAAAYQAGEKQARATYLRGAAGVGKSFAVRNLLDAFPDSEQCQVELSELFSLDAKSLGFAVEAKADLATLDGSMVFNELETIDDPADFALTKLLEAAGCFDGGELAALVVLDGLDEIHEDAATLLLEAVDNFILDGAPGAGPFVHFLVSGRPEGFANWLIAPDRNEQNTAIVDQFDLHAPRYQTAGDLRFRVEGYLDFAQNPAPSSDEVDAYVESFSGAVQMYPFLTYSIGNLAVGNIVIQQTAPDLEFSEQSLKAGLFDDMLVRNAETHGRPGVSSRFEGTYRRALEDIAARYTDVDSEGRFTVRSEDTVEAFDDEGKPFGKLRVRDVLDRSGVAFLTEPLTTTSRYTFDPFWLHAHLIERHNQRVNEEYRYRGCQEPGRR